MHIIYFNYHCSFMGNDIGNTTGIAKERGELYYLSDE